MRVFSDIQAIEATLTLAWEKKEQKCTVLEIQHPWTGLEADLKVFLHSKDDSTRYGERKKKTRQTEGDGWQY